ncbi:hypothetical protein GW17_00048651 [Ensete ventricosum]|nr:hypothetical protein GW17_00048651 [Ensete ventricosum]
MSAELAGRTTKQPLVAEDLDLGTPLRLSSHRRKREGDTFSFRHQGNEREAAGRLRFPNVFEGYRPPFPFSLCTAWVKVSDSTDWLV